MRDAEHFRDLMAELRRLRLDNPIVNAATTAQSIGGWSDERTAAHIAVQAILVNNELMRLRAQQPPPPLVITHEQWQDACAGLGAQRS
jgi:hypothetical protein